MSGPTRKAKRGEIYWMDWNPARGSEQEGYRPGVIVQSDDLNPYYSLTIVVALSTKGLPIPCHIKVAPSSENGLSKTSYVRCEQLMTTSQLRLDRYIGKLSAEDMEHVDEALRLVLDLYQGYSQNAFGLLGRTF